MPQTCQNLHKFTPRWLGLTVLFLPLALFSCSDPLPDEQQIRQRVEAMVVAARAKSASELMQPVHQDFLGNKVLRKANLRGLAMLHFRRHKNVHILVNDLTISLKGDSARVSCNVVMAGRSQVLPEQARILKVDSGWQKQDGEWFVKSASWEDPIMKM